PKRKAADQATKAPTAKKGKSTDTPVATKNDADKTSILIKGKVPVDSQCFAKKDTSHVYFNQHEVFHFMLNQTNLQNNNNKYYTGQVLEDDNAAIYSVWFRWGRVGKTAQTSLTPYGLNLQAAIAAFKKKFYEKTRNSWESRSNFVKKQGLYDMIEQDFGSLIMLICDIQAMEQTMREMNYDARRAPLGKLTPGQIKAGYEALNSISECLEKMKKVKKSQRTAGTMAALQTELTSACDRFYTRIPHDFG
ncbi:unnamed protein product, partial [Dibothriocephalus latus]